MQCEETKFCSTDAHCNGGDCVPCNWDWKCCKCNATNITTTTIATGTTEPLTCEDGQFCSKDTNCNGGECVTNPTMPYPICKCNITNNTTTTTIATSTTEKKCVHYAQCETDADCPDGLCWSLGPFSVCQCPEFKTTTTTTTKTTTTISETQCTLWASCENDFDCNGGKCTDIMGTGKNTHNKLYLFRDHTQMIQDTSRDYRKKIHTFILGKHCRCDITTETCVLYEKCQNNQDCPGGQCVYGDFGGVEYRYCQCNVSTSTVNTTGKFLFKEFTITISIS